MGMMGRTIAAVLLAILAGWAVVSPAQAGAVSPACSAALTDGETLAKWLESDPQWQCPASFEELSRVGHVVRFDLEQDDEPRYVVSRIAAFESLAIAARGQDGEWHELGLHRFEDIRPTYLDRQLAVPLIDLPGGTREIVVAVNAPTQAIPLDFMRLETELPGISETDIGRLLITALVCGIILTPLVFDAIFYRVLRESFILWHAGFVLCIASQLALTAGLYQPFVELDIRTLRVFTVSTFGAMVCVSMMFVSSFVERGTLSDRMRRVMKLTSLAFLVVTAFHAAGTTRFGPWPAYLFYCGGIPMAVVLVAAVVQAYLKGSIFVRYVVVGLTPLFLVAMSRVAGFLLPGIPTDDFNEFFLLSVVIEAIATALGVASRFVLLKRERDQAKSEARVLENLAGEDPLTGLRNRRSVETRFATLHRQGYDTIALIDLDHFKDVNDRFGHATGDSVLKATAAALASDADALAARIGGEEFMLLLRGDDGAVRAERLRQSIPQRVARDVSGLTRPVTASMGVITAPHSALPKAGFAGLFEMADKLLYEAKAQGRNRSLAERVRSFERRRQGDRRERATA